MAKDDHWRRRAELAETLVTEMRLALDIARTSPGCFEGCTRPPGHLGACTCNALAEESPIEVEAVGRGYVTVRTLEERDPTEHHRRQATGQQKRADRLKRDLAALHTTHARVKRGRRKIEQRLTTRTWERDEAIRARVKAERACASLKRALDSLADDLLAERVTRDALVRDAERAVDSEVELKHAAVRALRRGIGDGLAAIHMNAGIGTAETHLLRALHDVYDPDDGGVH